MVTDAILTALGNLLTLQHMLHLVGGVLLGISIGVLPGLGGIVGFSIMLPFLYGMDVTSALALLIGLVAVIPTSDTFTSVLMGIPGSSASQATVLDGYPLSKRGHAARALGAAFSASLIGGLIGALVLTGFILFARPLILALGSAELFMLGVLGLSMVGVLSGDNLYKGFLACGVGLLLGAVGGAPATGEWRMTFGSYYLFDGMKLVIVGLGVFALPEIVDLLAKNRRIASRASLGTGWMQGLRDLWIHKWIVARCAPLGSLIGAIPGLGGSVVDWVAYGHVVQTAKDKSRFGKGDIRGVIAPESANNAKEGGGLVPTLLFGIPGSGSMAVFLGGLTILGIEAGPNLVGEQLDISYIIIWSLALANVVGAGSCLLLSGYVARLTTIPYGFLAPFMIMVVCFAALQATRSLNDLALLLAIGCIGIAFKYFNWPRPALLIGFVLADTVETYLYQAVQFYSWSFITRPGAAVILVVLVVSVFMGNFLNRSGKLKPSADDKHESSAAATAPYTFFSGELLLVAAVLSFALYALADSTAHSFLGAVFPVTTGLVMLLFGALLMRQLTARKTQAGVLSRTVMVSVGTVGSGGDSGGTVGPGVKVDAEWRAAWLNALWLAALVAGVWLLGFIAALTALFVALIRVKTGASWLKTVFITACGIGFLLFISSIMVLHLPSGYLLQQFS